MATFLTAERRNDELRSTAFAASPLGPPSPRLSEAAQWLFEELAFVWHYFDELLAEIPVIQRVETGTLAEQDYRDLLLNVRQQVIEGGRWLAMAAASFSIELFPIRSSLIGHAADEHRDYQMLEHNYVAVGGDRREIETYPKNVGSEAFHAYMVHVAQQPDPLEFYGAIFIIEGLGSAKAAGWAKNVKDGLGVGDDAVTFLTYHGENDDSHYDRLRALLSNPLIDRPVAERLAKTAKVVARLYALQLEELGNI
jgi:3-oxoacyl-[acyl-carrier-protein] synthase-3